MSRTYCRTKHQLKGWGALILGRSYYSFCSHFSFFYSLCSLLWLFFSSLSTHLSSPFALLFANLIPFADDLHLIIKFFLAPSFITMPEVFSIVSLLFGFPCLQTKVCQNKWTLFCFSVLILLFLGANWMWQGSYMYVMKMSTPYIELRWRECTLHIKKKHKYMVEGSKFSPPLPSHLQTFCSQHLWLYSLLILDLGWWQTALNSVVSKR